MTYPIHPDDQGFTYASETELDNHEAWMLGAQDPQAAWIVTDRDVIHANPHYVGPPVPHPEEDLYDGYGRYTGSNAEWASLNAAPASYRDSIEELFSSYSEIIGDAGQYWHQCEETRKTLALVNESIQELFQKALREYPAKVVERRKAAKPDPFDDIPF